MVAETRVPGASVLIVARRRDVNSNHLFRWRRQLLPKTAVAPGSSLTRRKLSTRLHRGGTDGLRDSPVEGDGFELPVPQRKKEILIYPNYLAAHQLDPFRLLCRASHSTEPRAGSGGAPCGFCCCLARIASASWRAIS